MRRVTSSPLSLVSRETCRKKGVPMTAGPEVEMEGGTRRAQGLSLRGTLEIEPRAQTIVFPVTTENHCLVLWKS